ncbi:glucose PTS transporter transcription antiterminator GlcT [Macrococcoides caseolyticum]|uniref:glucose PTS transporter transcription antiterminator GlcT n=1 Tax=Macrococcoides caseolyticum TaxID=69966 RepID=UPI001F3BED0B|nr:PRD domain-containing protein [Macrococcus caseolyticus]MCE4957142.1 PRD domain-containing protein [Macrococcus caseolyticus]
MTQFIVDKVLNNNVLIARMDHQEVVLIGKGIGFGKKNGQTILEREIDRIEKTFVLRSEQEKARYRDLMALTDDHVIASVIEIVEFIDERTEGKIDDKIILSLTDHIIFALKRYQDGIFVANPFLKETEALYQKEFLIAEQVVQMLNEQLQVNFPRTEVGFIALHIHSSVNNHSLRDMNLMAEVITKAIHLIEQDLKVSINKDSIAYTRFVRHISFAVQRVMSEERMPEQKKLENLLKEQYPLCYNTAVKIVKMMQTHLNKPVYESELVYLTMHIQAFNTEVDNV